MSRADGWYFVRIDDEWRPAEWLDGDWDLSPMMALLILEADEDPISIAIHAENRHLRTKLAELEAQAAFGRRAVEMLREIQTIQDGPGVPDTYVCPSCWRETGRLSKQRHDDDCELAAILRGAERAQSSNGQAIGGLWQSASADDGMRNIDISDVCGGQTDCEPATVAVDAGALAELREAMTKFRMLPESAVSRPAGSVARERVMEAARRLLAGGE